MSKATKFIEDFAKYKSWLTIKQARTAVAMERKQIMDWLTSNLSKYDTIYQTEIDYMINELEKILNE